MIYNMIMHILAYAGFILGVFIIVVASGFIIVLANAMYHEIDSMMKDPTSKMLFKAGVVFIAFLLVTICVILGFVVMVVTFLVCGVMP